MFYVLAVSLSSLSASDWLFSAKPPADSQRRPDYERNPKTAPNGHRFSTAGWFPHGHGRGDISLGSHTHTSFTPGSGAISAKSRQIADFPLSAPAECLDTVYLTISTISPSISSTIEIRLLASHLYLLFGGIWSFHQKFICCWIFIFRNVTITFETCVGPKRKIP